MGSGKCQVGREQSPAAGPPGLPTLQTSHFHSFATCETKPIGRHGQRRARVGEDSRRGVVMAHCVKRTQFALPRPEKTLASGPQALPTLGSEPRQTKPICPARAGSFAAAGDKRAKQSQFRGGTDLITKLLCSKRVTADLCSRAGCGKQSQLARLDRERGSAGECPRGRGCAKRSQFAEEFQVGSVKWDASKAQQPVLRVFPLQTSHFKLPPCETKPIPRRAKQSQLPGAARAV